MTTSKTIIAQPLYSTLGKDPDLREIVELFVAEMPDRISTLVDRLDACDWEGVRRAVHQLNGAAGSYGFEPISRSAAAVEEGIRQSRPKAAIGRAIEELLGLCRRVQADPSA